MRRLVVQAFLLAVLVVVGTGSPALAGGVVNQPVWQDLIHDGALTNPANDNIAWYRAATANGGMVTVENTFTTPYAPFNNGALVLRTGPNANGRAELWTYHRVYEVNLIDAVDLTYSAYQSSVT